MAQFRFLLAHVALVAMTMLVMVSGAVSNIDCLQSTDPYPLANKPVGLSDASAFYATNYGTVGGPVEVRFVGGSLSEGDAASNNFTTITNSRTSNCFFANGEKAAITWGKSIDSAGEIIAIGAASRKINGQIQHYGAIDIYQVVPQVATPEPPTNGLPPARDIEDWLKNAPNTSAAIGVTTYKPATGGFLTASSVSIEDANAVWLGLGLALNEDGTSVATFFDETQIAVYETEARSVSTFNVATDVKIPLPANFVPDSLAYRGATIAVTGTAFTTSATTCDASVVIYSRVLGVWSQTSISSLPNTIGDPIVACSSGPSNTMPVRLSEDGAKVLISVVAWETVILADSAAFDTTTVFLANDGSVRSFGRSIDFAYTPASRPNATDMAFNVVTKDTILTFLAADFIATNNGTITSPPTIINQAAALYPNRQQRPAEPSSFDLVYVASNSGFAIGIDSTGASIINPSALAGTQYHPDLEAFIKCPPGFFQDGEGSNPASVRWVPNELWPEEWANITSVIQPDNFIRTGGLQQPCSFCPAGTYQDQAGSITCKICEDGLFCPPGSAYPYEDEVLGLPEYESGQGEFETESIAEAFEELVVNRLFSPSQPSMQAVLTLTGASLLCFFIYLMDCLPVPARNTAAAILNLFVYANLPEEEDLVAGNIGHDKHGHGGHGAAAHGGAHGDAHGHPEKGHGHEGHADPHGAPAHGHDAHAPGAAHSNGHDDHHGGHDDHGDDKICGSKAIHLHGAHCLTGFFNIIFLILCIATLVFAVTFLSHYNAAEPCGKGKNNCIAVDDIHYTDGVSVDYQDGFTALGSVQANLFVDIIGLTGVNPTGEEICSKATLFDVSVTGCTINSNTTRCNDTSMFEIADVETFTASDVTTEEFLKPQADHTCRLRWNIVVNTNFQVQMVTEFILPSFISWSSLRFWYLQSPESYDPNNPDSVIEHDGYAIGQTNFVENVQRTTDGGEGSVAIDSYPPSATERQWQYGVLGREIQTSSDSPTSASDYFRTWWNFVTVAGSNATTESYRTYITDTAPHTVIRVVQQSNYVNWRLQAVAKLIQPSLAFLTVLLGLIGVLHLVHFVLELTLVALHGYHNVVHAGRGVHAAATEKKGPNSPSHHHGHHHHGHHGHGEHGKSLPSSSSSAGGSIGGLSTDAPANVVVTHHSPADSPSTHHEDPVHFALPAGPSSSSSPPAAAVKIDMVELQNVQH